MAQHVYLAIVCKSCKAENLVHYVGPYVTDEIEALHPDGFEWECGRCTKTHRYEGDDLHPKLTDSAPPVGWKNHF